MADEKTSKLKDLLFGTQNISALIPGVILAVAVTLAALVFTKTLGGLLPLKKNPLSPILVAIVFGLILRNTISPSRTFDAGIRFGLKKLLRFGIILMGIRLSIFAVLKIGALAVGMVVICITAALVITILIAKKIGVSEKLGTLIAAGTSICGVSAIVATGPTIEAEEEEIAYAVGTITIFGILATIAYPYLTELVLRLPVTEAGFFLGTSVHDTSQVTATSLIYDQLWSNKTPDGLTGADIAITTKLVRNTFMMAVIPLLGFWFARKNARETSGQRIQIMKYIPLFVIGYLVMGIVRSLGDGIFGDGAVWESCWHFVKSSATYVIAIAIACIGLNTDIKKLTKLGYKPFICGLIAALSVGIVSWFLVTTLGNYLRF
jgi:uncharacterized integral membrane protein (TIGR00698 family)